MSGLAHAPSASTPIDTSDWRAVPLQGRLLIEASAGTGKTWTIAALYLRLLLDDEAGATPLMPERIVVATFTTAAAQELGERLRARLTQALQAMQASEGATHDLDDPIAVWLATRWQNQTTRTKDRQRLLAALAQLDRAPLGTLHGLCQRLLLEHPLDGGLQLSPLALSDGRRLHEALARDLLRRIGAGTNDAALPAALGDFETLVEAIGFVLQAGATVSPPPEEADLRALVMPETCATLRTLADPAHYTQTRAKAFKTASTLLAFIDGDATAPGEIDALCGARGINSWVREPAAIALRDPGFQQAMAILSESLARHHSPERAFWARWAPELRQLRAARSAELGELSFDTLIEQASTLMTAPGSALPEAVFARWPVALVDEFQDTDSMQYALLDRWFRDAEGRPRGLLAMVGDPKQAIYGFRGGDVSTYQRASKQDATTLRLGVNQRSSTAYVAACNALFDGPRSVLSADATGTIRYVSVTAAGRADVQRLHEHGEAIERPLVIHRHAAPDCNAIARPRALAACADLVLELLEPGRYTLGANGRALVPGDLAILLRTNDEIDDLRRALQRRGVPCAGQSRQQVFEAGSARDLLLVLHAIQHPGDNGTLRAALLTPLFRLPLTALPALDADEGPIELWRERFLGWRLRWQREGVLAAVLAVLDAARPALATHRERERIITDLRHLGELLQARESEGHAPAALLDWLRAQRRGEDEAGETENARSLRLESDARRVRLMTLHASKGLEFPVVLLPTLWGHEALSTRRLALAPAKAHGQREALFESEALKGLRSDAQDERFRLLYVALTRAAQTCHLFVLPEDRPARKPTPKAKSPPKPKDDPERSALDALLARWPEEQRASAPGIDWRGHWPRPCGTAFNPSAQTEAVSDDATAHSPRPAPGRFVLPTRWSFTRLAGGHERRDVEAAAADDESPQPNDVDDHEVARSAAVLTDAVLDADTRERVDAALTELAGASGKAFGNALHQLLEGMGSGQPFVERITEVEAALTRHAVRIDGSTSMPTFARRVAAMLDRVLAAELAIPGHVTPLRLGSLPAAKRRMEMRFHFVLGSSSLIALRDACAAHGEPALVPPGPVGRLSGGMEGSIDLVFEHADRAHVLDWKSNAIAKAEAAQPQALIATMDAHHYRFQAFLYTLTLHRLLRQRLGARYRIAEHLGAPIYVFLRAAGLAPGLGVWSQRFPDALVEAADALLAGDAA